MAKLLLCVLALICGLAYADVRFTANMVVTNVPGVQGFLAGTLVYYYNTTAAAVNHWKRIDWNAPISTIELYDYAAKIRYKKCTTCEAETYTNTVERIWYVSTADTQTTTTATIGGLTCRKYTRTSDPANIVEIWVDTTGTVTSASKTCRIVKADGSTFEFSSIQTGVGAQSLFTSKSGWSCPAPTCTQIMDIVLVVDESGSISTSRGAYNATSKTYAPSEWAQQITFCQKIAASYTLGARLSTIGAVFFDNTARIISNLTGTLSDFNNRVNTTPKHGSTCIGCGLRKAREVFDKPVAGRTDLNPSRLVIVMTDGNPNVFTYNYTYEGLYLQKVYNALVIGIGIGSDVTMATLKAFTTYIPGVETTIKATSFDTLGTLIDKLVSKTCDELPPQQCSGCLGYCSCGKTCVCPMCQTGDACTSYNCASDTKACVSSTKNCDDSNACTDQSCSPTKGCIYSNVTCTDGDMCTIDKCSPSSGCYYTAVTCPSNACYTARCSSVEGCKMDPIDYSDGNPCTIDGCDNKTGPYHIPKVCDDGSKCTTDSCNTNTGECVYTGITCADTDPCTVDTCDPASGCVFTKKTCDDGDECTTDSCVPGVGTCLNELLPTCYCKPGTPTYVDCSDKDHKKPCMTGTCVADPVNLGKAMCSYQNLTSTTCNSNNLCIIDGCNPADDSCIKTEVTCNKLPCQDAVCNPATGICSYTPRNCPYTDPCNPQHCNLATDRCEAYAACPHQTCFDEACDSTSGSAVCSYTERNCNSGSDCILDTCNNATDTCEHSDISCDDANACTIDSCNPVGGCHYEALNCDDGKLCTNDTCDTVTGCVNTEKCVDGLYCTDDYCNPTTGFCSFPPVDCSYVLGDGDISCYVTACTEKAHCYKKLSASAVLDVCGGCINLVGANATTNLTAAASACLSSWSTTTLAVALTGAAVAGIIVAAVIGGLIVLAASSFGTYELVKRAREAQNTHTVSNPLYKDSGREMTSSIYTGQ